MWNSFAIWYGKGFRIWTHTGNDFLPMSKLNGSLPNGNKKSKKWFHRSKDFEDLKAGKSAIRPWLSCPYNENALVDLPSSVVICGTTEKVSPSDFTFIGPNDPVDSGKIRVPWLEPQPLFSCMIKVKVQLISRFLTKETFPTFTATNKSSPLVACSLKNSD